MPDALEITASPIRCTTNPSERLVGTVVLVGLGLGWWVSPWFYLIVVFAGANLLQSAITGFCPPEILFDKFADRG